MIAICLSCGDLSGEKTGANDIDQPKTENQDKSADLKENPAPNFIGGLVSKKIESRYMLEGTTTNGGNSSHAFKMKFSVSKEKLSFHLYTDSNLENGLNLDFHIDETNKLIMKAVLNTTTHEVDMSGAVKNNELDLVVELHNDHTDAHLIIWHNNGQFVADDECSWEDRCIYNSEGVDYPSPWLDSGRAAGNYWGVSGNISQIESLEGPIDAFAKH